MLLLLLLQLVVNAYLAGRQACAAILGLHASLLVLDAVLAVRAACEQAVGWVQSPA